MEVSKHLHILTALHHDREPPSMHLIGGVDKRKICLLSSLKSNPSHPTQQVTLLSYLTSQNDKKKILSWKMNTSFPTQNKAH
jgi:hypothetical protein